MPLTIASAGVEAGDARHLSAINKPRWLSGAGVRIGVIDTGYDPTLPDFAAPFTAQFAECRPAPPSQCGQPAATSMMVAGVPPRDLSGNLHGSAVCAFLAGNISGVAPGATVSVAAVPSTHVLANQAQFVVALNWLLSLGQDIITTSISTGLVGEIPESAGGGSGPSLQAVELALERARTVHKVLVIAAIGNYGSKGQFQHPGSSMQAIGVGAADANGKSCGSAWGRVAARVHKPDIVAPGYRLTLPVRGGSHTVGGTSFAAAIVAGAAALVLEKHPELRGNPAALSARLLSLAGRVKGKAPRNSTGAGMLDLSPLLNS